MLPLLKSCIVRAPLITLVHEQGTLLHEEHLEDGVRIVGEATGPYRAACSSVIAPSRRAQNAQNDGLMQQIKECMTSRLASAGRIGVGPARGRSYRFCAICAAKYPARYIKINGMMG